MKFAAIVLTGLGLVVLLTGLGFLLAYPTMWLVNYLFSATFLTFVFGTAKLSVLQAWVLNIVAGILFKSTNTTTSK
jgi:hypothetical protein